MNILEFIGILLIIKELKKKILDEKTKLNKKINSYNRIDDIYFKDTCMVHNHQDAVICMIDICNYSQWCNNKSEICVFNTMQNYNLLINQLIKLYNLLEKIEIVGDSVMVIGWIRSEKMYEYVLNQSIKFATLLLKSLKIVKELFNDDSISLRIGIHRGYTCSGFMNKPRKYQVFGNSVNLASRIESIADNGTCMISDITLNNNFSEYRRKSIDIIQKGEFNLKGINGRVSCSEIKLIK